MHGGWGWGHVLGDGASLSALTRTPSPSHVDDSLTLHLDPYSYLANMQYSYERIDGSVRGLDRQVSTGRCAFKNTYRGEYCVWSAARQ